MWRTIALALLVAAPAWADNADKARSIVANVCSTCHGMDGNSTVATFPKLAGRDPEYLERELKDFIGGRRKSDIMAPIAAALDSSEIKALGAYFGSQKPVPGKVLDPVAAAEGKKLYDEGNEQSGVPACGGCHGVEAEGNGRFPRLAGQHREYLVEQLYNFRTKVRSTTRIMREVSARLTDAEIKAVAEFLGGL